MTTDPARWQQLSHLFDQALDLPAAGRAAFVAAQHRKDAALGDALQRMLDADASVHGLDDGAIAATPRPRDADEDAHAAIGDRLGAWRLESLLGCGGMGSVYGARRVDDDNGQRAAIKRLQRRWTGSAQAQRFLQERRILARLSHANIPALLDHGIDEDGRPWFALEYVDGDTLLAWADARRLGLRERVALFLQVCAAVQHAHAHFIVHRDLKPANILVDAGGRVRVLDFGVAKRLDLDEGATRTGLFAGFTPQYAAPEQISGGAITAATDVYGLGVVLYQLLAGQLPYAFAHHDLRDAAETITTRSPERLDRALTTGEAGDVQARVQRRNTSPAAFRRFVRGDLTRIVQTALAKEPARRYASVQTFADDLQRFLAGRPVSVSGDTFGYHARKFVRRHRWGVAMAAIAAIALGTAVIGIAVKSREALRAAAIASAEAQRAEVNAARARQESERMAESNEFLRSVFSMAAPGNSGTPNISLRDALDLALQQVDEASSQKPQVRVRFLLAAASSFEALGEMDKSEAAIRTALAIQERDLPDSREDRARVLTSLAWQRMNFEPEQALAWAQEALALHLSSAMVSDSGLREAYSVLASAHHVVGDAEAAIEVTREGRRHMLDNGVAEGHQDIITSWSNEAVTLTELGRYDEAVRAHEKAIALRSASVGADSVATALERVYYGFTLNRAGRPADALAQLEPARAVLEHELGRDHDSPQLANLLAGRALLALDRAGEAAVRLQAVHAYARAHPFEDRQGGVGTLLADALARVGRCAPAREVLRELADRGIAQGTDDAPAPLSGTPCASTPLR